MAKSIVSIISQVEMQLMIIDSTWEQITTTTVVSIVTAKPVL